MAAAAATTTTTLEREILKRNTDCVYFLASPLTCKKGSECEYRHSDIARLNPRDCWYWLSGNCLNPTCAFRHPPLEGLKDASSISVHVAHHSVATASKTNVPCYFYFNTYCMKGDQCPFSHSMDDVSHAQKFPKIAPEVTASHLPMAKACTGSDTGPAAVEASANFTEVTSNTKELIYETPPKNVDDTTLNNISDEPSSAHDSPVSSNPDYEEPIAKSPDNASPEDKYMNAGGDLFSEHSSEELVKDCSETEEWWESSPGFDVLVDDVSEQLAYEDDADYLQVQKREPERLHNHLVHYDYEDSTTYDPMDCPDGGFVYDHCLYDAFEHFSDGYAPDYAGRVPEPSGERRLDSMLHKKRRSSHKEWDTEQHGVDLRDHLRKRRRMDALVSQDSRKCRPSYAKSTSQECPERHGVHIPYHGRLSSELGRELGGNMIRLSHREMESALDESCRRGGRLAYPHFGWSTVHSRSIELHGSLDDYDMRIRSLGYRDFGRPLAHSRQRENRGRRGRQERLPSMPKALAMKETRPRQVPVTTFTGPKTLTQIREERKEHTGEYGSKNLLCRQHRRVMSSEFEGPKPLSELLKDKKKFKSVSDSRSESATDHETTHQPERRVINGHLDEGSGMHYHGTSDGLGGDFKSEFLDIAEDDEDDLARWVAGILA